MLQGLRRASRGKNFGNEIADSMGLPRNLFHTAVEGGGFAMHLITLASLKDEGASVVEAREMCLPYLSQGIENLKSRFGNVPKIMAAKELLDVFSRT